MLFYHFHAQPQARRARTCLHAALACAAILGIQAIVLAVLLSLPRDTARENMASHDRTRHRDAIAANPETEHPGESISPLAERPDESVSHSDNPASYSGTPTSYSGESVSHSADPASYDGEPAERPGEAPILSLRP